MTIKLLLTDVDGTAVLSEHRNRNAIEHLAREGGYEIQPKDWDRLGGKSHDVIWELICEWYPTFQNSYASGEEFDLACIAEFKNRLSEVKVNQPVRHIVDEFNAKAIGTAAVSNSPKEAVIDCLKATNYPIDDLLFVLTKTEVLAAGRRTKPEPDPYLMALEMANENRETSIHANEVLVLEDTKTGAQAALRAGMNVIHISDDSPPMADREVEKLEAKLGGRYYYCNVDTLPMIAHALRDGYSKDDHRPQPPKPL